MSQGCEAAPEPPDDDYDEPADPDMLLAEMRRLVLVWVNGSLSSQEVIRLVQVADAMDRYMTAGRRMPQDWAWRRPPRPPYMVDVIADLLGERGANGSPGLAR
jgi:hypothetical protein